MVDVLIKNALIVTMDKNCTVIPKGSIGIEDGRISFVSKGNPRGSADEIIDAQGKIVMPGLICSHTHLYGILLRGAVLKIEPPTDFAQILQRVWWPMDEAMNKEDAYASALAASLELAKTGTTMFADTFSGPNAISGVLDRIGSAVEKIGIRGILAFESTERNSSSEGAKGMKENIRFIKKVRKTRSQLLFGMISIHASFTVSDELLQYGREVATRYRVPLTIHTSEGLVDVYHNYIKYGKRTVERLNDLGVLKEDVVLAHCVHLNRDELCILQRTGAKVAHNPMSNMLNAVGVAPVPEMLAMNIDVGLGNDGYIFDGFENIRAAFLIHKVASRDPRIITAREVLEMATIKGAELYGLADRLGSIEKGKLADLIIIDTARAPTPVNANTVLGHLVNTFSGSDVETVIVGGRVIVRERKLQLVDEEYVSSVCRRAAAKLWPRIGKRKVR
jgi:putative selenium metabolism protein SsnA